MRGEDDIPGKLGELLRYGTVESVDLASGKVAVRVGDIVTDNINWFGAAGGTRLWLRPKVGEQILLLAPEADIEGAIALRGVNCDAFPAIADQDREVVLFEDGARISYDPAAHTLEAVLPAGATARIEAPDGITLVGDVRIEGKLHATEDATFDAKVTATGEIQSGAIKLTAHKHGLVKAGTDISDVPQ